MICIEGKEKTICLKLCKQCSAIYHLGKWQKMNQNITDFLKWLIEQGVSRIVLVDFPCDKCRGK
jgi:hypothetical protein